MEAERDAVQVQDEARVTEYASLRDSLGVMVCERRTILNLAQHALPFLQPGQGT